MSLSNIRERITNIKKLIDAQKDIDIDGKLVLTEEINQIETSLNAVEEHLNSIDSDIDNMKKSVVTAKFLVY